MLSKKEFAGIWKQHWFKIGSQCAILNQKVSAWIRLFQNPIPHLFCGDFFDSIGQNAKNSR